MRIEDLCSNRLLSHRRQVVGSNIYRHCHSSSWPFSQPGSQSVSQSARLQQHLEPLPPTSSSLPKKETITSSWSWHQPQFKLKGNHDEWTRRVSGVMMSTLFNEPCALLYTLICALALALALCTALFCCGDLLCLG